MDELITQIVTQSPNFVGFMLGFWVLTIVIKSQQAQNARLIEAILKRENCEDGENVTS